MLTIQDTKEQSKRYWHEDRRFIVNMSNLKKESNDKQDLKDLKENIYTKKEEEIITDKDLIKDPSLEDVIKQDMKKKKKLDKKKSDIKVNPEMDIGVFSGGRKSA